MEHLGWRLAFNKLLIRLERNNTTDDYNTTTISNFWYVLRGYKVCKLGS